jgi:Cu/Ag efflux protein CusF
MRALERPNKSMKKFFILASIIAISAALGCHSAPEKHYPLQGEVISVEAQRGTITVKHGEILGLMPAMTMSYMVAERKQIETLRAGDKISADLVVSDSKGRLEKIVLVSKSDGKPAPPGISQGPPEKVRE